MTEYHTNGNPILSLQDKLDALRYCIDEGAVEDAIGHIFCLLDHVVTYKDQDELVILHDHYATNCTPLKEPRMDSSELETILFKRTPDMATSEREIDCNDMVSWAKDRACDDIQEAMRGYASLPVMDKLKLRRIFAALSLPDNEWETLSLLRDLGYWNGNDDTFWEEHPKPFGYQGQ